MKAKAVAQHGPVPCRVIWENEVGSPDNPAGETWHLKTEVSHPLCVHTRHTHNLTFLPDTSTKPAEIQSTREALETQISGDTICQVAKSPELGVPQTSVLSEKKGMHTMAGSDE